jgi:hypothetical protein
MIQNKRETASFRDPSGFLFWRDGELFRQINHKYQENYDLFLKSGLYQDLVDNGLLIPHQEVDVDPFESANVYRVIRPKRVAFISYPYEWSFGQLKDAALTTLTIQKRALSFGMSLKDSSAYNIQFSSGKPILIDTLSFEKYEEGKPWVAYRQFCQHFLAPLALMSYCDVRLGQLLRVYIDGIPMDLTSELLPFRTRFNLSLLTHIHLHAAAQKRYAGKNISMSSKNREINQTGLMGILISLESIIKKLTWNPKGTDWADYDSTHNYNEISIDHKKQLVSTYIKRINPKTVWDFGANTGVFSRLASQHQINTIAFDIDPGAVELNYRQVVANKEEYLYPLLLDLSNPSPDLGWHNHERRSLFNRGNAGMVLALALVHHLAITNNVPLEQIARFLADAGEWLVIEFVPKDDPQTQRLLASREDIFVDYSQERFEEIFGIYFQIEDTMEIKNTGRTLYLMKRNGSIP